MTVLVGQLTTGGASDIFNSGDIAQTKRNAAASGTADTMKMVVASSPGCSIALLCYADSAGAPGVLLGQTAATAVVSGTMSISLVGGFAVTSGVDYHVSVLVSGATLNLTDSTPGGYSGRGSVVSVPDPFGSTAGFSDATNSLPITVEGTTGSGAVVFTPTFQAIPFTGGH